MERLFFVINVYYVIMVLCLSYVGKFCVVLQAPGFWLETHKIHNIFARPPARGECN